MKQSKKAAQKASRELEILVAKIQAQLAPEATIEHDVKLLGRITNVPRQIDVLMRQNIGQYEMLIAIECKDQSRPVDVKGVETFQGLLEDVGVHRGVMVCPSGFWKTAKIRAQSSQIDLYSPVDTEPHKWQARITAPVLCDFRAGGMALGLRAAFNKPFQMANDFFVQFQWLMKPEITSERQLMLR